MPNKKTNTPVEVSTETGLINGIELPENQISFITSQFAPFVIEVHDLKEEAKTLKVESLDDVDGMIRSREIRLLIAKQRTTANTKKIEVKDEALRYGKAVQSVFNLFEMDCKEVEKTLLDKEKFIERMEETRLANLKLERETEAGAFLEHIPVSVNIQLLTSEEWTNVLTMAKNLSQLSEDQRVKEEAEQKIKDEETEKLRLKNKKLADENLRLLNERLAREKTARKIETDRVKQVAEAKKIKDDAEKLKLKNKKLADENTRLAKEKVKRDKEIEVVKEAEVKKQNAPDKEKLLELAHTLRDLEVPLRTVEAEAIFANVKVLLTKTAKYITEKTENL